MSQAYSGVSGNVFVSGTDIDIQEWNADVEMNTFDSTTTADLGWDDETAATAKVSGAFKIFHNPTKSPTSLGIVQGATVPLILYVSKTDNVKLTGNGMVKKISYKTTVKGGVEVTVSYVNKGPWVMPA